LITPNTRRAHARRMALKLRPLFEARRLSTLARHRSIQSHNLNQCYWRSLGSFRNASRRPLFKVMFKPDKVLTARKGSSNDAQARGFFLILDHPIPSYGKEIATAMAWTRLILLTGVGTVQTRSLFSMDSLVPGLAAHTSWQILRARLKFRLISIDLMFRLT
jgi:hypothetical protein